MSFCESHRPWPLVLEREAPWSTYKIDDCLAQSGLQDTCGLSSCAGLLQPFIQAKQMKTQHGSRQFCLLPHLARRVHWYKKELLGSRSWVYSLNLFDTKYIQNYTNIWYMHPVSSKSLPYFLFHVCLAQKLYGHTCFIEHWDKEWFSLRQLMWRWDCENMQGTGQNQKLCHWYLGLGREAWLGWAVTGKHVLFLKTESTPSWKEPFTCSRRNLIIAKHRFLKGLLCFLKWACLEWKILVQKDMVVSTHTASFTLNLLFWLETSFFHGMLHNWVVCYLRQCCTLEKTSGFLKWNVVLET